MDLLTALFLSVFLHSVNIPAIQLEDKLNKNENILASYDGKQRNNGNNYYYAIQPSIKNKYIPGKITITPTKIVTTKIVSSAQSSVTSAPVLTTITSNPTTSPTPASITSSLSLNKTGFIMDEINNYRASLGLIGFQTDSYTCNFAALRAKEISGNFNHDGFTDRLNNNTLPFPAYSSIVENIAMNSDYKNVFAAWKNSSGHDANLKKNTTFACVGDYGDYYVFVGWTP